MSRIPDQSWKSTGGGSGGMAAAGSTAVNSKNSNKIAKNLKNRINATHFIQKFDDHEDVKTGIREVLLRLEPLVKVSAGNAPLESMMGFLEELDDSSFEKYLLVRHIKSKLRSSLLDLVQSEVQLQCRDTQLTPEKMKIVAPAILSKLMTSQEMEECMNSMQDEIGDAASEMCVNFDRELVLMSQLRDTQPGGGGGHPNGGSDGESRNSSSLSDSLSSTWNPSGFVFIQPNQYVKIADKLNPYRSSEDRIEAINTLLLSQVGECVSAHCWAPAIKEGLQAALLDTNAAVAGLAFRFFSKLLANVSPFCTKEAFVALTTTVKQIYKDRTRNYQLPSVASEISFKKRPNHNLLQTCRLITSTCRDLPKNWSRYPASIVEDIMQAMLDMVTMKSKGQKTLSPIHLISLVDPKAKWLKAWMHGNLGRQLFFHLARITHDNLFFKTAMHHLLVTLERPDTFPLLSRTSGRKKGLISSSLVSFAFFSHNLHVTCLALQYHHGQKMFPLNLPNRDELSDGRSLIKAMVTFVANARIASHQTPAKILTQALINAMASDKNIQNFWILDDQIINLIIVPLLNWPQLQHSARALNLCQILAALLKTPSGRSFVIDIKTETGLSLPDFLLDFTSNFLKSLTSLSHQNEQVLVEALNVCQHIAKSHVCALTPRFEEFVKNLNHGLADIEELYLMTPTNSMANINFESHASELKKHVFQVLKSIASTPLGLYAIVHQDGLYQTLVLDAYADFNQDELACLVTRGTLQELLDPNAAIQMLSKIDTTESTFITLAKMSIIILDPEMFENHKSKLEEILPGLNVNFVIGDDAYDKSLTVLMVLLSNLDVRHTLLTSYDIESNLKLLLQNCQHEDGSVICDQESLTLQYILESLKCVGGITDRKIIRLNYETTITKDDTIDFNDDLNFDEKIQDPGEFLALLKEECHGQNIKDWKLRAKLLFEKHYSKGHNSLSLQLITDLLSKIHNPNYNDVVKESTADNIFTTEKRMADAAKMYQLFASKQGIDLPNQIFRQIMEGCNSEEENRWLLLILTLMFKGNFKKAKVLSKCFQTKQDWTRIGHCIELIMKEELPMILTKMKSMNISPGFVGCQWLKQYFLNSLNFMQIVNFVLIESLYSSDYAVFMCISIFRHLETKILSCNLDEDLILVLLCDPISNFRYSDCLDYMHNLARNYAKYLRQ